MKSVERNVCAEGKAHLEEKTITASDVMSQMEEGDGHVRLELSPINKAGICLAGSVLALIAVISLVLVGGWIAVTVTIPSQSNAVLEGSVRMFETVIPKILPILTLLIGYLFGRGEQDKSD